MQELEKKKSPPLSSSSSSSSGTRCRQCGILFVSSKAMFGHLRVHRKKKQREAPNASPLQRAEVGESEDAVAASILMSMKNSQLEADAVEAKLCQLRWICTNVERQRKNANSLRQASQRLIDCRAIEKDGNLEEEMKLRLMLQMPLRQTTPAAEVHKCDKCDKVFSTGQALGGHKRAHYTGPPLAGIGGRSPFPTEQVKILDFDLNELAQET